jgi:hypothetical protein
MDVVDFSLRHQLALYIKPNLCSEFSPSSKPLSIFSFPDVYSTLQFESLHPRSHNYTMQFQFNSTPGLADRDPRDILKQFNQRRQTLQKKAHELHRRFGSKVAIYVSNDVNNWIYESHHNFPAGVDIVRHLSFQ